MLSLKTASGDKPHSSINLFEWAKKSFKLANLSALIVANFHFARIYFYDFSVIFLYQCLWRFILVALAAIAATTAFAQSSVQVVGSIDAGMKMVDNNKNSTAKFTGIGSNNVTTSNITFKGTDDIGGGMKGGFLFEIDPSVDRNTTLNQSATSLGQTYTGASAVNGEAFVSLSGAFGDVKMGTPNSPALVAGTTSTPFGTALGGGWSGGFGRLGTAGISGLNQYVGGPSSGGRIIRSERAAVFTTPDIAGFKAMIEYSGKNSNGGFASNDNGLLGLAASYNNGPLNAMFSNTKVTGGNAAGTASAYYALPYAFKAGSPCATIVADSASTAACIAPAYVSTVAGNALASGATVEYNVFGANYALDVATTLYFGYTTTKGSQTVADKVAATSTTGATPVYGPEDSKSWNIAGKYVMGQWDFLGNYLQRKSNLTVAQAVPYPTSPSVAPAAADYNSTQTLIGLGVNYNFSKSTLAYLRYEQISGLNAASAPYTGATQSPAVAAYGNATQTTTALGIKTVF